MEVNQEAPMQETDPHELEREQEQEPEEPLGTDEDMHVEAKKVGE